MKYTAYQVAPEHQESPYYLFGADCWEGITIAGNREFRGRKTREFEQIEDHFDHIATEWVDRRYFDPRATIAELLRDYGFERPNGGEWTNREKHAWRVLFEDGAGSDDDRIIVAALGLLTGKRYACTEIHGCAQGEWNDVYYPVDEYDREALDMLETEYFNTGSEWRVVCDEDEDDQVFVYAHDWHQEAIRRELADSVGCEPEDMCLLRFTGWARTPEYEEAV